LTETLFKVFTVAAILLHHVIAVSYGPILGYEALNFIASVPKLENFKVVLFFFVAKAELRRRSFHVARS
jgi:hypothetical protein